MTSVAKKVEERIFTMAEVAHHRTADDCWIVHNHKVYDITGFINSHPGGPDIVLMNGGKDVTAVMNDPSEHKHSAFAFEMMADYLIGKLEGGAEEEEVAAETAEEVVFLDINKPVWPQMWNCNFTKEFYLEQVHIAHHMKDGAPVKIFGNFLEPLTMTPWYVVPLIWVPVSMVWAYLASATYSPAAMLFFFALGLFHWTFIEYVVHRFIFHIEGLLPDHPKMLALHFLSHGIHHYLPMDHYRLVMPPALFTILMVPIFSLYHLIAPHSLCLAIGAGTRFGYVMYDMVHYYLHHGIPAIEYLRSLKTYHLNHHYLDWQQGFGITNVFWDVVFGTYLEMKGDKIE